GGNPGLAQSAGRAVAASLARTGPAPRRGGGGPDRDRPGPPPVMTPDVRRIRAGTSPRRATLPALSPAVPGSVPTSSGSAIMSEVTTDHETIRKWADQHGGRPAAVEKTHSGDDVGIVRL